MTLSKALTVLAVFVLSAYLSSAQGLFDQSSLLLDLRIGSNFELVPKGEKYNMQSVTAELSWKPVNDYRQSVEKTSAVPEARNLGFSYLYEWNDPKAKKFLFSQSALVRTTSDSYEVRKKIEFPLKNLSSHLSIYLRPGEIIDSNDEIASLAARLAFGENDAFIVVSKLAEWVESNVRYDLSTLTADASQKSSWVLENRVGVCDELTSLFISMARSLGIPARFVSGISYSNIIVENNGWGAHGWAEVYFPEVGWVPFDVTYKEWGFVDASHIKLKTSPDAKETSVEYRAVGSSVSIMPGPLNFSVKVLENTLDTDRPVALSLSIAEQEVGFGSYNLLRVDVTNNKPYYVAGKLYLSNVTELKILSPGVISFVLKPHEQKSIYWLLKVSDKLDKQYIYTIPLRVSGNFQGSAQTSFRAHWRKQVFSESYMRSLLPQKGQDLMLSSLIDAGCNPERQAVYVRESIKVTCTLKSRADRSIMLKACFEQNCTVVSIAPDEALEFNNFVSYETLGIKTLVFKIDSAWAAKNAFATVAVIDKPEVFLSNLTYQSVLSLDDESNIKFRLQRDSLSQAYNIVLSIEQEYLQKKWEFPTLSDSYEVEFRFSGRDLRLGKNTIRISIGYEDDLGNRFGSERRIETLLQEKTLLGKFQAWLNNYDRKVDYWTSNLADAIKLQFGRVTG